MNHKEYLEWLRQSSRRMKPPKIIHDPDNLPPTATNTVYILNRPESEVPYEPVLPKRFKSKCKRHRREARGW